MKKSKKLPKNSDLVHLLTLLKYTERNIKNDGNDLDDLFKHQAFKLSEKIRGLK